MSARTMLLGASALFGLGVSLVATGAGLNHWLGMVGLQVLGYVGIAFAVSLLYEAAKRGAEAAQMRGMATALRYSDGTPEGHALAARLEAHAASREHGRRARQAAVNVEPEEG